jgi:FtsZ-binding cell division protein ZapB
MANNRINMQHRGPLQDEKNGKSADHKAWQIRNLLGHMRLVQLRGL